MLMVRAGFKYSAQPPHAYSIPTIEMAPVLVLHHTMWDDYEFRVHYRVFWRGEPYSQMTLVR